MIVMLFGLRVLFALLVGWLLAQISRTMAQPSPRDDEDLCPAYLINVAEPSSTLPIRGGGAIIGRNRRSDICFRDQRISARHAAISASTRLGGWWVSRLGAAPLQLDARPLQAGERAPLVCGSRLTFPDGRTWEFEIEDLLKVGTTPPQFSLRRKTEGSLLVLCSALLLCGLLSLDIGLHLDVLDGPGVSYSWLTLWITYTALWLLVWLIMNLADWWQARRQYAIGRTRAHYPHQVILPTIAFLVAAGVLVGYRLEPTYLSPEHQAVVAAATADGSYVYNGATRLMLGGTFRMLWLSMLGVLFACGMRILGGSFLHPTWLHDVRNVLLWHTFRLRARIRLFRRRGRLVRALAEPQLWLVLIVPIALLIFDSLLLAGRMTGLITTVHGQIVSVPGIGQPSELARLAAMLCMVGLVTAQLQDRLQIRHLIAGVCGLGVSLMFYVVVTRDLGPLFVSGLTTLGLLVLTLPRRAVLGSAALFAVLLAIMVSQMQITKLVVDQQITKIEAVVSRPARDRDPEEYARFCADVEGNLHNVILCQDDQTLRWAQSAAALGSITGAGPGRGVSTPPLGANAYIPSLHSDYVFIPILEEYGVIGGVMVLAIYFILTVFCLHLGQTLQRDLLRVVATACGLWWAVQVLVIVSGTLRALPLAGLPAPFISFGRTAALSNGAVLGLLLVATIEPRVGWIDLHERRQTAFATLRMVVVVSFWLACLWFTLGMYLVDRNLFYDTRALATVAPGTAEYTTLMSDQHLGRMGTCYVLGRKQFEIRTADGLAVVKPVRSLLGCERYTEPDTSPAEAMGLARVLQDTAQNNAQFGAARAKGVLPLTIDSRTQRMVADRVEAGLGTPADQPWALALVMKARGERRGEIVAFVDRTENLPDRENTPLSHAMFNPGSVFKVVTTLAALRLGLTPEQELSCGMGAYVPGRSEPIVNSFADQNCRYAGEPTNLAYALAYSVNTFFAGLSDVATSNTWPAETRLPIQRSNLSEAAATFGMIRPGTTLGPAPYESWSLPTIASSMTGRTSAEDQLFQEDTLVWADTTYGQGHVLVTPVQLAVMMQLIAADGQPATPRLVADAHNPIWEQQNPGLTPEEAQTLRTLLHSAVTLAAEQPVPWNGSQMALAGAAQVRDAEGAQLIAGKTGTAQYDNRPEIHWFAGIAPAESPEYVVVVMTSQEAGLWTDQCGAAAIAGTIFDTLLRAPNPISCQDRGE